MIVSDPASKISMRRAPGRHTDQTEAKADVLTCNKPCSSVSRGDLMLIHHRKPELPRHLRNRPAQLPHNHL